MKQIIWISVFVAALNVHGQTAVELGYFHSQHVMDEAILTDWIVVPNTWEPGQQFPGNSLHSHRFRDTTWTYRFNNAHPFVSVSTRLLQRDHFSLNLHQVAMYNSWRTLSFMFGLETAWQIRPKWHLEFQVGALSGYGQLRYLRSAPIRQIGNSDVIVGVNASLTYELHPDWRLRFYGNEALLGMGISRRWTYE